ncbi:MAG TPA: hypothetical protein VKX17_11455 [Planctomycetota bacterium]|nr:hypothetical protein [Planctomycetota bacterium]
MQKFRGVSIIQRAIGGTIFLKWSDPRRKPAKQKFTSSKSDQPDIAERIASEISTLIYGPVENWRKPPKGLHPRTYTIWNATEEVKKAVRSLPIITKSFVAKLPEDRSLWNESNPEYVQVIKLMEAEENIRNLLEELSMTRSERDSYRERCKLLEGQFRKMNAQIVKSASPKPLEKAIAEYFKSKDGTTASGMWRKTLLCWCERLKDQFGGAQDVHEITADDLIKHIEKFKTSSGNKKQLTNNLCKFLTWATDGQFDARLVKKSILGNLPRQNEEWYWLTNAQALAMIENLKKLDFGQYWSDLATIQ